VVLKEKGVLKGRNHINGIEGFWSFAKHWLYYYRGIPKANFPLYLKERGRKEVAESTDSNCQRTNLVQF